MLQLSAELQLRARGGGRNRHGQVRTENRGEAGDSALSGTVSALRPSRDVRRALPVLCTNDRWYERRSKNRPQHAA
jgi:hypothetical protein